MKIACLAGDGIGPEIMAEARRVLVALDDAQRERRPFFRPRTRLSLSAGR